MARVSDVDEDQINYHINWDNYAQEGNPEDYQQLLDFIDRADLSQLMDFTQLSELIDLDNFIDYHVLQIALANGDWPNNNVKIWKHQLPGGKWRLAVSDLDGTLKSPNHTVLHLYFDEQRYLLPDWERREKSFYILRRMWDNRTFRQLFVTRLNHFLKTTMSPERSLSILNQMKMELLPEMPRHIRRWHYPKGINFWENAIEQAEAFLLARPTFLLADAMTWLGTPVYLYPNPVKDCLFLEIQSYEKGRLHLSLMDKGGREVLYDEKNFEAGRCILKVDLPMGLASGFYYLKMNDGQLSWVEKVVVVKY